MAKHVIAAGEGLAVVTENRGNAPVVGDFRVSLHVNPDTPPTGAHETGDRLGSQGLVRAVRAHLAPGETLTLTVGSGCCADEYSHVAWPLGVARPVYAQVDSANVEGGYGGVLEDHEISGRAYDNVAGPYPSVAAAAGAAPPVGEASSLIRQADLPAREPG